MLRPLPPERHRRDGAIQQGCPQCPIVHTPPVPAVQKWRNHGSAPCEAAPAKAENRSRAPSGSRTEPSQRVSAQALLPTGAELSLRSPARDRKSTRLNSSHVAISYAVFCLKKK